MTPTGVPPTARSFSLGATLLLLVALIASGLAVTGTPVAAQSACDEVMPVSEVVPGDTGYGLTVARGTIPEPFDVEVVDVLENALAPGFPLIIVEADSPEIDRVGGIWAGMSGSPVYVDGKLLGAIAYGFSWSPSKLAGVTPAEFMLQVPGRPTLPPPIEPAEIELPSEVRAAAIEDGVAAAQAGTMRPLEVPVVVSGLAPAKFEQFKTSFERQHPGTKVVPRGTGSAATANTGPETIVPGGNLAVSLFYGDAYAMAIGTVTAVCDGTVIGFGHPLLYDGATRLGMHGANAIRVIDDPLGGSYKLANPGPPLGTIDQDRLAGVAGRLGPLPASMAILSEITNLDEARTVTGRTDAVWPEAVFDPIASHLWTHFDALVFDDPYFSGTSEVRWTIEGLRRDGSPWSVTRENRYASRSDLSSASLFEVAGAADELFFNRFEDVRITTVDYEASAGSPYRSLEIVEPVLAELPDGELVDVYSGLILEPGSTLRLHIPLREFRSTTQTLIVELEIPADVSGSGSLSITGGNAGDDWYYGSAEAADVSAANNGPAASFDELLQEIASRPRSDELTVTLSVWDGEEPVEPEVGAQNGGVTGEVASTTVRLDEVVSGSVWAEVLIEGPVTDGCPVEPVLPFEDVDPDSIHALSIGCLTALGVARGVSEDPPLFAPALPVRRDQAASFVARVLNEGPTPLPAAEPSGFTDITGNVHGEAIEQLATAGIVQGRTPTTYDPSAQVTRAQMATMLVEALRWATGDQLAPTGGGYFWDVDPDSVHATNIDVGFELGLLQGRDDGSFRPSDPTRRDQMATLLMRFYPLVMAG